MSVLKFSWLIFLIGLTFTKLTHSQKITTQVGEQLEMQCGEHKVVLTCGRSEKIATRQRKYPRLCNDNTLNFYAKDGTFKTFTTYKDGNLRDMTPMDASCRRYVPLEVYSVDVGLDDTAASRLIDLYADGSVMTGATQPKPGQHTNIQFIKRIAIKE